MRIKIKSIYMESFKGVKSRRIDFSDKTKISGANATGKTTVADSFSWLLFDKDSSGSAKFQIRPLDSTGKQIDNVDIMVEAALDIDGKAITLKRTQRQKWVKKRGTDVTELQGNENLFEINGYPKSEKDYKEYISDLVNEDLFKLITNPNAFTALPWKKQREILMKLVDDMSDVELAQSDSKFTELIPELEMASPDDIRKKYTKALNTWKKRQIEIPARIDEVSKQIVDIDVAELELQRNAILEDIYSAEKLRDNSAAALDNYDKVSEQAKEIKSKMRVISDRAEAEISEERRRLHKGKDVAWRGFDDSRRKINLAELEIENLKTYITGKEKQKQGLQGDWIEEKKSSFRDYKELPELSEDSMICPTCGQKLPEEQKRKLIMEEETRKEQHYAEYLKEKEKFEEAKKKQLGNIENLGNAVVAEIKEAKEKLEQLAKDLEQAKEDSMKFNKLESEAMDALSKLPVQPDLSDNQEYEALELELQNTMNTLNGMDCGADYRNQLKIKLSGLREELAGVEKKIASADNTAAEKRIAELEEEQRDVAQKVADQEKMIVLLEAFIKFKLDKISDGINNRFKTVNFKLFDVQLNGGVRECCECTVNGIPYSVLNNGHRIVAGLDIIRSLSDLYRVSAPIFTDNAESINDFNIPDMNAQMILLAVSDDKELKVEVA